VGCRLNNLVTTRYLIKVTTVKKDGAINIGKQQKPVLEINQTQTANLNSTEVHNLKSSLIKPSDLKTLPSGLGSTAKNLAIVVTIPPMIILPLVLTAALCNCLSKNEPGSSWSPLSIQDRKYNSESHGTFRLLSRANKEQARIR